MLIAQLLTLFLACNMAEEAPAAEAAEPTAPMLISPGDGVTVEVDVLPVFIRLPTALHEATATVTLDGEDITDPLGFIVKRWTAQGGGSEYLATLELGDVAPGAHTLSATFTAPDGTAQSASSTFTWAPPPCAVDISVADPDGAPLSARVSLFVGDTRLPHRWPRARKVDPMARDTRLSAAFVRGEKRLHLPARTVTFIASRGIRDELATATVPLEAAQCADGPQPLRLVMRPAVDTPNQITADFHVHTGHSGDSYVPDRMRLWSLEAADLDLVVFSDHNRTWDPSAVVAEGQSGLSGWAGAELRLGAQGTNRGHINVFPLDPSAEIPAGNPMDLTTIYARWQEHQAANPVDGVDRLLVQLNHPRGIQIYPDSPPSWRAHAVFTQGGFDRSIPVGEARNAWMLAQNPRTGETILDFDTIEVINRYSWAQYQEVRQDWFLLLNLGRTPTGVGNSDSHALALELVGYPVNLVSVDDDPTTAEIVDAVRGGALTVSSGPVVDLRIADAVPGGRTSGAAQEATVTVRAASWIPAPEVRLVVNGQVTHRQPLPETIPPEGVVITWPLALEADSWVVAEAGWPPADAGPTPEQLGQYALVAPGYVPVGFTNPVWIDADGDGLWKGMSPQDAAATSAPMQDALKTRLEEKRVGPAVTP